MADLTEALFRVMAEETENAIKYKIFGAQLDHIEKIERIADHPDGYLQFKVTMWHDLDDPSRIVKVMNLFDLMLLIGHMIGLRAGSPAVDVARKAPITGD